MNKRTNPANLVEVPMQGQRLPANWQEQAKHRAAMAEAAYRHHIENAWRNNSGPLNVIQKAGLANNGTNHQPLSWDELTGNK